MKQKRLRIVLLVCIALLAQARAGADSAHEGWKTADTLLIRKLVEHADKVNSDSSSESAMQIADSAIRFSDHIRYPAGRAMALYQKGRIYLNGSKFPEATEIFQQAQDIYK